ncbi:MAG: hypothetical protein JW712_10825 [Dehalococcoidales bacterium]|nr:hypothetical protein [Dehalococcoidales bacterium]
MVLKLDKETMDQLIALIDERVQEKLEEILGDSDEGLVLTEETKAKIEESLAEYQSGDKGVMLEDFAKEMGIDLE